MAVDVIMPAMGATQETGRLVRWLKQEGASVVEGEALMEVETDKSAVEVEAPATGVLARVAASPGDDVPVGQVIALIVRPDEDSSPSDEARRGRRRPAPARRDSSPGGETPDVTEPTRDIGEGARLDSSPGGETPAPPPRPREASDRKSKKPAARAAAAPAPRRTTGRKPASPAARRLAVEKGVDLARVTGTGPEGAVVARDVLSAASDASTAGASDAAAGSVPLHRMRCVIGERMTQSKRTAPHFYLNMDVDMTGVEARRSELRQQGVRPAPSINDFVLRAVSLALSESPAMNAVLTDRGLERFTEVNLGVAVALEDGLVAPVIRNADRLGLRELARRSRELASRARSGKLEPADCEGGAFTVSNLGMFGVDSFAAIINPPQSGILAVGRAAPRVVPRGEDIAVRSMMTLTLSADHRVVDGAIGARFLQRVKQHLEAP